MESPTVRLALTLSGLERSKSLRFFPAIISHKGTELGHMLLLDINRKSYVGSLNVLFDMTKSDLERLGSMLPVFQSLMSRKAIELRHMLLLVFNTNKK